MLPLLENLTVAHGWITQDRFLAGYGAAQAMPGPLFAFSAYLRAVSHSSGQPLVSSILAVFIIFLPGLLLITVVLPFWGKVRKKLWIRKSLQGVNAAVEVLISALFNPIWASSIHSSSDFMVALRAFLLLIQWKTQPWIVVLLAGTFTAAR